MGLVGTTIWFIFVALSLVYLLVFFIYSAYHNTPVKKVAAVQTNTAAPSRPAYFAGEITERIKLSMGTQDNTIRHGHFSSGHASLIGGRKYQEDSFNVAVTRAGALMAVVCDGMGGLQRGSEASRLAVKQLFAYSEGLSPLNDDVASCLRQAAIDTDLDIVDFCGTQNEKAGTTAVAALLIDNDAYWLSVGDSRIYLRRDNELFQITRDHNYAMELQQAVDAGEITQEQAMNVERPDALISFLGMGGLLLADTGKISLERGDTLVLCSDGLFKSVAHQEMCQMLDSFGSNVQACAEALVTSAVQLGGEHQDNTTVVVINASS